MADGVHDHAVRPHQRQVAVAAHDLQIERLFHVVAHFIQRVEANGQNPVAEKLLHPEDPRPQQVLAHQHTEHGRLGGVFIILSRQLGPGLIGVGAQKQPVIAPAGADQQRQRVPFGLINLIHPAARQLFI